MVYVDELVIWDHAKHECFMRGSCHLEADTLDELHRFANLIGLKREWFQPRSSPHYDLSPSKREIALRKGAVFRSARESALLRLMNRETEGFAIVDVVGEEITFLARFVKEGIAFELASVPGESKADLLGACFRCLREHKSR